MAKTVYETRRVSARGREPKYRQGVNTPIKKRDDGTTDQKFAYEILGVFVEARGKGIIQGLDLLPREVLGQSLEREFARDHLENDAA